MDGYGPATTCEDHCRIGSLEMRKAHKLKSGMDHCRIGSLEMDRHFVLERVYDHCRIGSLEMVVLPW